MRHFAISSLAALALLGSASVASAAVTTIDTCGQTLSGQGVLTQDLDCGGSGVGVSINFTGKLDLAGFTIANAGIGVSCAGGCTVFSTGARGTIRDSTSHGVFSNGRKVTIENILVEGSGTYGVWQTISPYIPVEKFIMIDSEISGSGVAGFYGYHAKLINSALTANAVGADPSGSLRLIDSVVSDNIGPGADAGVSSYHSVPESKARKVIVTRSTITRNGDGMWIHGPSIFKNSSFDENVGAGVVFIGVNEATSKCLRSTFDRNGTDGIYWADSIFDTTAKMKECSASDNGARGIHLDASGVYLEGLTASDLVVTGNGEDGIIGNVRERGMVLKRSTISGNGGHGIGALEGTFYPLCDVKLIADSTATGNGTLADCGVTRACADVATCSNSAPEIATDVVCETSYVVDSGIPGSNWGVCSLD